MTQLHPQSIAEECAKELWKSDEASQHLDMEISDISPGHCQISMRVSKNMCNGHGTCHGGYIFTLADSAFAFACNTYNQRTVAYNCSITYLMPASDGDLLKACAKEISKQGRNGIYDITIENQNGDTVAEFRGHSRTIKGTLLPDSFTEDTSL